MSIEGVIWAVLLWTMIVIVFSYIVGYRIGKLDAKHTPEYERGFVDGRRLEQDAARRAKRTNP